MTCLFLNSAGAQTVTFGSDCPTRLQEKGMVAEAFNTTGTGNECGGTYGYCKYRDTYSDGMDHARKQPCTINIDNTGGGSAREFTVSLANNLNSSRVNLYSSSGSTSPASNGQVGLIATLDEAQTTVFTVYVSSRHNYTKDGNIQAYIQVVTQGYTNSPPAINIIDDDGTSYVGRRKKHPEGLSWETTPCCKGSQCRTASFCNR